MAWFRINVLRKPIISVDAVFASVFPKVAGIFSFSTFHHHHPCSPVFSSLHPHHPKHSFSSTSDSSSYAQLQTCEATRVFQNSVIKKLDVVFLGSKSPIEDRFVVGTSENLGGTFLSVIDGHRGIHCSQYLQENMLQRVSAHLHDELGLQDDLQIVLNMDLVEREAPTRNSEESPEATLIFNKIASDHEELTEAIQNGLCESLTTLDDKISQMALSEVHKLHSGHPVTPDIENTIMTAVDGACSLTTLVRESDILVANTGDCRVVLGRKGSGGTFSAVPLSTDQNAENLDEVARVHTLHPGEENTVISRGRLLGCLVPFRTFGDVDFKWEKKNLHKITPVISNYLTPPYVTAEPVVTRHQISKEDKFMILATDGLWEMVSNEDAVNTAAGLKPSPMVSNDNPALCTQRNMATELLWHALGGNEEKVFEMLQLKPEHRHCYRDDITIMVVHLN